ncbi:MAG: hypothetical protein KF699_04365, partial [Phycisphaeraceae bacterium]|nr:hypothetical protein [Phycisphaeraceae bacterium]
MVCTTVSRNGWWMDGVVALLILAGIIAATASAAADAPMAHRAAMAASMATLGNAQGAYTINVTLLGTGSGVVGDDLGEITCGADCTGQYGEEVLVTLSAIADPGSFFAGWSGGGCFGTGPCEILTIDGQINVTATFMPDPVVDLQIVGTGTGEVRFGSEGGGGTCSTSCSPDFPPGTMLTLTATPDPGSYFAGWSGGGCSGTAPCFFTLGTESVMITATFTLDPVVDLQIVGSGTGEVRFDAEFVPGGVCNTSCSADFPPGTMLTLTATPDPGSFFTGWSGAGCSGTGSCMFTLGIEGAMVTATFISNRPPVAACRDVTIDATSSCPSFFITVEDVDNGSTDPDLGLGDEITLSLDFYGPFPIGQTMVTLTVTDLTGLSDSCTAMVTVLAIDCNNNGVPDVCDIES